MKRKPKLIRVTTINRSLNKLLEGQLSYMSQHFDVIGVSSPDYTSKILRDREKVEIVDLEMSRKISPLADLKSIWKMYRLFRQEKPNIVHSHTPKAGLVTMVAGYLARVPIRLHTIAGLPLETSTGLKRKVLILVEKLVYKLSTITYPNSHGIKEFITENNLVSNEKVRIIGYGSSNGIDLEHFKRTPELIDESEKIKNEIGVKSNEKVFLFVGRLVVDKGIEPLIIAWQKIAKKYNNIKLVLVGTYEGDLSPLPANVIKLIEESENILHLGYKMDVRPYFCLADYFVFPSYREGLPNVVLQAGALELPMIVTNINGNTDIVDEGVNGIIVEPKSSNELERAMEILLTDESIVSSLRSNARKIIEEKYDRQYLQKEILNEYKRLLKTQ